MELLDQIILRNKHILRYIGERLQVPKRRLFSQFNTGFGFYISNNYGKLLMAVLDLPKFEMLIIVAKSYFQTLKLQLNAFQLISSKMINEPWHLFNKNVLLKLNMVIKLPCLFPRDNIEVPLQYAKNFFQYGHSTTQKIKGKSARNLQCSHLKSSQTTDDVLNLALLPSKKIASIQLVSTNCEGAQDEKFISNKKREALILDSIRLDFNTWRDIVKIFCFHGVRSLFEEPDLLSLISNVKANVFMREAYDELIQILNKNGILVQYPYRVADKGTELGEIFAEAILNEFSTGSNNNHKFTLNTPKFYGHNNIELLHTIFDCIYSEALERSGKFESTNYLAKIIRKALSNQNSGLLGNLSLVESQQKVNEFELKKRSDHDKPPCSSRLSGAVTNPSLIPKQYVTNVIVYMARIYTNIVDSNLPNSDEYEINSVDSSLKELVVGAEDYFFEADQSFSSLKNNAAVLQYEREGHIENSKGNMFGNYSFSIRKLDLDGQPRNYSETIDNTTPQNRSSSDNKIYHDNPPEVYTGKQDFPSKYAKFPYKINGRSDEAISNPEHGYYSLQHYSGSQQSLSADELYTSNHSSLNNASSIPTNSNYSDSHTRHRQRVLDFQKKSSFFHSSLPITRRTSSEKLKQSHVNLLDVLQFDDLMDKTTSSRYGSDLDTSSIVLNSVNNSRGSLNSLSRTNSKAHMAHASTTGQKR